MVSPRKGHNTRLERAAFGAPPSKQAPFFLRGTFLKKVSCPLTFGGVCRLLPSPTLLSCAALGQSQIISSLWNLPLASHICR